MLRAEDGLAIKVEERSEKSRPGPGSISWISPQPPAPAQLHPDIILVTRVLYSSKCFAQRSEVEVFSFREATVGALMKSEG